MKWTVTKPIIPDSWTDAEKYVWEQVKQGSVADFNIKEESDPPLDPSSKTAWPDSRKLRSEFLHTILLKKEYHRLISHKGVAIVGAWFPEPVDLSGASINHLLELQQCRFDKPVEFKRLKSSKYISLRGSTFSSLLDMNGMQVENSLFMDEGSSFAEVNLVRTKIDGQVSVKGSTFSGLLNMNSMQVKDSLFMNKGASFTKVDLVGAKIDGQVSVSGSTFSGLLDMNAMKVEASLFMDKVVSIAEVDFTSARISKNIFIRNSNFSKGLIKGHFSHIGGNLDIRGSKLNSLDLSGTVINGEFHLGKWKNAFTLINKNIYLRNAYLSKGPMRGLFPLIGGNQYIRRSQLDLFDLSGAVIDGEFHLAKLKNTFTNWESGAELRLINTKVGALQDHPDEDSHPSVWPEFLELDGFTYERLGGFAKDGSNDMFTGRTDWYINTWLKKQEPHSPKPYSPQPYVQLAEVMKRQGHKDSANKILYAAKERERKESSLFSWRGFALRLEKMIGYGYRFRNAFYTLVFLIVFGVFILHSTGQGTKLRPQKEACTTAQNSDCCAAEETAKVIFAEVFYSVDKLIPLLKLGIDVPKDSPPIDGWVKYYFYLHGIIGYVLGALIASWLAGLMKP